MFFDCMILCYKREHSSQSNIILKYFNENSTGVLKHFDIFILKIYTIISVKLHVAKEDKRKHSRKLTLW